LSILVNPQGNNRIDVGGAAGGNPAGGECDREQKQWDNDKGFQIVWPDAIENAG
jgi:hypothetical protein